MLTLADAILQQDLPAIHYHLRAGTDINEIDEYGFRPIIEAAIMDNVQIAKLLLAAGADPNLQDAVGSTALHWACDNNNVEFCQLLLGHNANPNSYNFAGQSVLVMPILRRQVHLRQLLIQAGATQSFAQDYINTKVLGHMYELMGLATLVTPDNKFIDMDFEGFFLEVTISLIADSLAQFQNHFAARKLRQYAGLAQYIVEILKTAGQLIHWQQYRTDLGQHHVRIMQLLGKEPLVIPVAYEGHAITFIKLDHIWVKCDRREESRLFDNIMFYKIGNLAAANSQFLYSLLYEKHDFVFINQAIDQILSLQPLTELKVTAQISGNCSWANVEACIPSLFFLILMKYENDTQKLAFNKTLALNFFHRWREWNKDRALNYCLQSYTESDVLRKMTKAEILAAIAFQCCITNQAEDGPRIERILAVLLNSPYAYMLQNYLRIYYYESYTEEGKRFADIIKHYQAHS